MGYRRRSEVERRAVQAAAEALVGKRRRPGVTVEDIHRLEAVPRALRGKKPLTTDAKAIVEHIAGLGFSLNDIREMTGLSNAKLSWLKKELRASVLRKDVYVAQTAYLRSVGGPEMDWEKADGIMARWWMERRKPEWRRPPDKVIGLGQNTNLDRLTNDELEQLERLLAVASGIGGGEGRPATSVIEHDGGFDDAGGEGEV